MVNSHLHDLALVVSRGAPDSSDFTLKPLYCGKKVLTSRISGPDKYQQVVLGVCRGAYGPMVNYSESF